MGKMDLDLFTAIKNRPIYVLPSFSKENILNPIRDNPRNNYYTDARGPR